MRPLVVAPTASMMIVMFLFKILNPLATADFFILF
jgi:hypothetical protein